MLIPYQFTYPTIRNNLRAAAMRVTDSGEAIEAELDVPGTMASDLTITFERGDLTISGKRKLHGADVSVSCSELVRAPVDVERATARLRDGVLTITLPKSEAAKPRRIAIQN